MSQQVVFDVNVRSRLPGTKRGEALSGNRGRCTGCIKIVEAVLLERLCKEGGSP